MLPRLLQDLSSKGVVSVSANHYHTAFVTKDGELFTCGKGEYGKLGHGDESDQKTPKRVEALVGKKVTMVSCGRDHTALCTKNGRMHTFGKGKQGQLGHGLGLLEGLENKFSPAVLTLVGKYITQVQCGIFHTMALTSTGHAFTCGTTQSGRLGHGYIQKQTCVSVPCLVEGLREHNVVHISCGISHCAALVDSTSSPSDIRPPSKIKKTMTVNNCRKSANVRDAHIAVLTQQKNDYFAAMFRFNIIPEDGANVKNSKDSSDENNCEKHTHITIVTILFCKSTLYVPVRVLNGCEIFLFIWTLVVKLSIPLINFKVIMSKFIF
jgi:hypothetical protein